MCLKWTMPVLLLVSSVAAISETAPSHSVKSFNTVIFIDGLHNCIVGPLQCIAHNWFVIGFWVEMCNLLLVPMESLRRI